MPKYNQGQFRPKNPQKYVGSGFPTFRSSWELTFMNLCDTHPNIIQWASESINIPYTHPGDLRVHQYVPDFLIVYVDKNGKNCGELVEIKPMSQTLEEHARTRRDAKQIVINRSKWRAAQEWCRRNGLHFRIITEYQLYRQVSSTR